MSSDLLLFDILAKVRESKKVKVEEDNVLRIANGPGELLRNFSLPSRIPRFSARKFRSLHA